MNKFLINNYENSVSSKLFIAKNCRPSPDHKFPWAFSTNTLRGVLNADGDPKKT